MVKVMIRVLCRKETKMLLKKKQEDTGRTASQLVEYAINNLPYIPPKVKRNE